MADNSIAELRKFVAPEFVFGMEALDLAGRYARHFGARKVFIVTDPGIISNGWLDRLQDSLAAIGIPWVVFSDVSPNPRDTEVMAGAEMYQREYCNLIIALGGGSPMDCAKGIGIVSSNHKHICEFEGIDQVEFPMPPLICIPTTAGSSADVSQFAIISDTKRRIKIAIVSKTLVPDVALIDPQTLVTMPDYLCACTGMDALTHAIEAYVSSVHSPVTDLHALYAVRLLHEYLPQSIGRKRTTETLCNIMLGSMEAGLAFSNAILGAVHAMAHSLGGRLDLPHGECNAILLGPVISANFAACPKRYIQIAAALGLQTDISAAKVKVELLAEIERLKKVVGIHHTLRDIGLERKDIPELAATAIKDPCMATNPCELTIADIIAIFEKAF